jgi:benzoylformate decarboxylase
VPTTVRDAVFEVLRNHGVDRIFANPGSTEVDLLTDLPDHLDFVLALHEGSVLGMATGHAIAAGKPALALLHTTAGYGNAVGGLATARANRAPVVLLVGQQDRRHLAAAPFLVGDLATLAGSYPVSVEEPARAGDVPGAIARALHDATVHRGPAVVIIPMSDWAEPADEVRAPAARRLVVATSADPDAVAEIAAVLRDAERPALVLGSLADDPGTWSAVAELATALDSPVWQAAYSYRMGFDQTSPLFAGHLPPGRAALRDALGEHDVVLVLGAHAFRQYLFEDGDFVGGDTRVLVVTEDADEAVHSDAELAVIAPIDAVAGALAQDLPVRAPRERAPRPVPAPLVAEPGAEIRPGDVFQALAERLPAESTYFEESPSTRRPLLAALPVRAPFGFLTAAMGGLGFAVPGAIGVKMARPERPVVAIVGDGASLYNVQALWSAQKYGVGVLFVVMSNGGYAVMDRLAHNAGATPPWPGFGEISLSTLAAGFGCPARRIETVEELLATPDEVVPTLGERTEPLVLDIAVTTS